MQNRNGLFWGIALVTLGLLFLGRNLDWYTFDWAYIRDLWPLLLILAGANLILIRRGNQAAIATTILLALALPVALFSAVERHHDRNRSTYNFRDNFNNDEDDSDDNQNDDDSDNDQNDGESGDDDDADSGKAVETRSDTFVETLGETTREATLNLSGGTARFVIGESAAASDLIKADTKMTHGSYTMSVDRNVGTGTPVIELKPTGGKTNLDINKGTNKLDNRIDVRLNEKPVWTVNVGMGAGQGDLDLSRLDVKKLDIGAGAADLDIKLGNRATESAVKISSAVASITVRIPKDVGCRIDQDGALNLSQLDDFTKISDTRSETPNYAAAAKKIIITYNGGMSKFKVVRY